MVACATTAVLGFSGGVGYLAVQLGQGSDLLAYDATPVDRTAQRSSYVLRQPDPVIGVEPGREETAGAARSGPPVAVSVPSLGISAPVVPVEPDGTTLVPPADPTTIGWWDSGVRPGAGLGRVLLTGHTVSTGGGAFDRLGEAEPGATVAVATTRGLVRYRVLSVETLSIGEVAERSSALFGTEGQERLVLVTCTDWDGVEYHGNTIVTAEPVS